MKNIVLIGSGNLATQLSLSLLDNGYNIIQVWSQQLKNANKAVMIQHGDYITIYYNLASISVKKGDKVSTKDPIGKVFTHPITKQTVIKFMVYRNDTEMNPADWVYKM